MFGSSSAAETDAANYPGEEEDLVTFANDGKWTQRLARRQRQRPQLRLSKQLCGLLSQAVRGVTTSYVGREFLELVRLPAQLLWRLWKPLMNHGAGVHQGGRGQRYVKLLIRRQRVKVAVSPSCAIYVESGFSAVSNERAARRSIRSSRRNSMSLHMRPRVTYVNGDWTRAPFFGARLSARLLGAARRPSPVCRAA